MYQNQGTAASGAYTTSTGAYPTATTGNLLPPLAPLDELEKQLEGARERIMLACRNIGSVADTLFGAMPESAEKAGSSIPFTGRLGGLNRQAETLHTYIFALEQQINRLNSLSAPTDNVNVR